MTFAKHLSWLNKYYLVTFDKEIVSRGKGSTGHDYRGAGRQRLRGSQLMVSRGWAVTGGSGGCGRWVLARVRETMSD